MKRWCVVMLGLALATSGCAAKVPISTPTPSSVVTPTPATVPATVEIRGVLAVVPAFTVSDGATCMASGKYVPFNHEVTQVVIKNAAEATVGIADLGDPQAVEDGCVRWFTATVTASDFYTASVGTWKSQTYAAKVLVNKNLVITLD